MGLDGGLVDGHFAHGSDLCKEGTEVTALIDHDHVGYACVECVPAVKICNPNRFCGHGREKSGSSELGSFIDDWKNWFSIELHNAHEHVVFECDILGSKRNAKATWPPRDALELFAFLYQVLESLERRR